MIEMNNPPHPGSILKGLYLDGIGISVTDAANALGISRKTLSQIINGHSSITPNMALILSQAFPTTTPRLWMNLQQQYDLWYAKKTFTFTVEPLQNNVLKKAHIGVPAT